MAERLTKDDYLASEAMMDRPIPGMSLTNDPNNPAPYEQPLKITNIHEANNYLWEYITEKDRYIALMGAMDRGVPVMILVQTILFNEFQKGTFNPDLMLMAAEPLAYMFIALAERLDIDVVIDTEEEEGDIFGVEMQEGKLEQLKQSAKDMGLAPSGFITKQMEEDMKTLPSLLEAPETEAEPEQVTQQPSLMAPPEGQ